MDHSRLPFSLQSPAPRPLQPHGLHLRNAMLSNVKIAFFNFAVNFYAPCMVINLYISDFLDKLNAVADNLAFAGNPVSDTDLVSIIMNNVGAIYVTTVRFAQARDTSITYDALKALLLSAEHKLQNQNILGVDTGATTLHASQSRIGGSYGRGGYFFGGGRGMSSCGALSSRNAPSSPSPFYSERSGPHMSSILVLAIPMLFFHY